jgi:hypothetical protein
MADAVPLSGGIDPRTFPFLIVQLHRSGATGSFKVEGPSYQKALYIRSGRILFGSSNDPRDQLGAILIESGKITPEQLEDVNGRVGPGNPLAKVLADTGYVSQRELSEAARAKVERIFADVVAYESGSFEFEDGVLPKGAVDLKLNTERLIVSAVRRIPDRSFVLRHLGGVNAVLLPSAGLAALLPEIHAEVGRLPEQLDGTTTLKDAAAGAALDEFDAAKIACALLFLGAIELQAPAGEMAMEAEPDAAQAPADDEGAPSFIGDDEPVIATGAAPPAGADAPVAFTAPEPEDEPAPFATAGEAATPPAALVSDEAPALDLGATAAAAFAPPEPTPAPAPPAIEPPAPGPASPFTEPPTVSIKPSPRQEPAPPPAVAAPVAAAPASPMRIEPERPARPQRSSLPLVPPPAAPPRAEGRDGKKGSATREDLAAVDALLHSRTPEGPLTPGEKGQDERWAPKFGASGAVRGKRDGGGGKGALVAGLALLLLAGGAAAWWYVSAQPAAAPVAEASPSPAPALDGARGGGIADPGSAAPPPDTAPATTAAATDPRGLLRQGQHDAAARGFADELRAAGPDAATIQLLIACSTETVDKAVANAGGADLIVLPTSYQGRNCYRLAWGVYPSSAVAAAAIPTIPEYFARGGARPRVHSTREVLP